MKLKLMLIFIFLISIFYIVVSYDKQRRIDLVLESKTKEFEILYNTIYNQYKDEAKIIYSTIINKDQVLNIYKKLQLANVQEKNLLREKLYKYTKTDYDKLKFTSIKQFHYHLKNNESFLRMHRVNKFGDNLELFRPSVAYVNKTHKAIDGFEEGRVYNGFRFVFPLSLENEHLGSVEVSFSASAIIAKLNTKYNEYTNMHIDKSIVNKIVFSDEQNNYIDSHFKGFLIDKEIGQKIVEDTQLPNRNISNKIINTIKKNQLDSFYDDNLKSIITVLPITNPITKEVTAFISTRSGATNILNIEFTFKMIMVLAVSFCSLLIYFVYKELNIKQVMQKQLEIQKAFILKEQEENKNKERILFQQSKMASLGEMLENIAHQWRQPLSVISTSASGIEVKKEYGMLTDEFLDNSLESIITATENLSNTIDKFREYFQSDKVSSDMKINEVIEKVLFLLLTKLKDNHIEVIKDTEDINYSGIENEIIQILINILSNAADALTESKQKEKYIFIKTTIKDSFLEISIKDTAGGIPLDIIDKIFEPYFTTKHKSQGTGIGLFMTEEMVVKHMKGLISVENSTFVFNDKKLTGALFTIQIPMKSDS